MSVYKSPYFGTGQELDEALLKVKNSDAEAWATGQRNGVDVTSTDETYQNNAKYYAEQAGSGGGTNHIPAGGTDGQMLYKDGTKNYALKWGDAPSGKSAYEYAVEGGYTGTEEEFAAKMAEEMPTKLPNPNALTFSGAVTGSYDGSAPLSVEIPSGAVKIETGTYTGTGAYGNNNPCTLTFGFTPKAVFLGLNSDNTANLYASPYICGADNFVVTVSKTVYVNTVSVNENTMSWYSRQTAVSQLNAANNVYSYVAIG